jgi:hypothetical protein
LRESSTRFSLLTTVLTTYHVRKSRIHAVHGLALEVERRLERRIGDLLGPGERGQPGQQAISLASEIGDLHRMDRNRFRLIAEQWEAIAPHLPCTRAEPRPAR